MKALDSKLEDFLWGDTIHNTKDISTIGYGFRNGWKEALEWVLAKDSEGYTISYCIRKELGEE